MKSVLLILFLLFVPCLLGFGFTFSYNSLRKILSPSKTKETKSGLSASFLCGICVMLLLCEVSHILTLITGKTMPFTQKCYGILLIIFATVGYIFWMLSIIKKYILSESVSKGALNDISKSEPNDISKGEQNDISKSEQTDVPADKKNDISRSKKSPIALLQIFSAIFFLAALILQLYFILSQSKSLITGNEMVETVRSLTSGAPFYSLNPLTGLPYTEGIPTHLKILCLPTFYGILSQTFQVLATTLVWNIMPAYWLVCGYIAIWYMATSLLPKKYGYLPLLAVSIFVFLTNTGDYAWGFLLLNQGYLDTVVRSWVLLPFVISSVLNRKYIQGLLPVLAEAVICWTRFGLGTCFLAYLLLAAIVCILRKGGAK